MQALNFVDSIVGLWQKYERCSQHETPTAKFIVRQSLLFIVNDCKLALNNGHDNEYFNNHKQKAEKILEKLAA
jgi:hypothetical protein